jgi:molecular chaperone DnaK
MPGRLGIDFGTSNTVLALWNEGQRQAVSLPIAEYSHQWTQAGETVSIIPSLIHYAENDQIWIGEQVIQRDLQNSPLTMRWMKRYISHRSPMKVLHKGLEITPYRAGQDFLNTVLISAAQEISPTDEEVGLSVPVESFEHYENWLTGIAEAAGMSRFRLIDEPSAAALGYGAHIQPGNVYLIFDFGGGTMHTSVVLIETEEKTAVGRRCRVLGKAGRDIGGATIDQWLFQDVLRQNRLQDGDPAVRRISNQLLVECQRIKELLTDEEAVGFSLDTGISNIMVNAAYTRSTFDDLLDQNDLFTAINQIVRSTLNMAVERGYREEDIQAVLMVGGSSQIPSVQRAFRQIFG